MRWCIGAAVLEAGPKHGFMEDFRVWAELKVTRFYDGVRFVVRRVVGIPTGEPGPAPVQPRRRSQSENNMGSSAEDVSAFCCPEHTHCKQKILFSPHMLKEWLGCREWLVAAASRMCSVLASRDCLSVSKRMSHNSSINVQSKVGADNVCLWACVAM